MRDYCGSLLSKHIAVKHWSMQSNSNNLIVGSDLVALLDNVAHPGQGSFLQLLVGPAVPLIAVLVGQHEVWGDPVCICNAHESVEIHGRMCIVVCCRIVDHRIGCTYA